MSENPLPEEFADLAPLVDEWSLRSEKERHDKRVTSRLEEVKAFYGAVLPRMDAIIAYLDRFPLAAMPPDAQRLYFLALTCMEMSHPIDLHWRTPDIDDAFPSSRLEFLPVRSRAIP